MFLLARGFVGLVLLAIVCIASSARGEWRVAEPGWQYEFPRDHGNHPDFKTEWWYFTGNLRAADGREFGYQLTFFRQGIARTGGDRIPLSRFVTRQVKLAHFTVTDVAAEKFVFFQRISRGAFGEAGFDFGKRLAWIDEWIAEWDDQGFVLRASDVGVSIDLQLQTSGPPLVHGSDGISRKGGEPGQASHYYSLPDLKTTGTLTLGDTRFAVTGTSWFDHEWATNQLGKGQVGWDWLSLHLSDGSKLMLFQLRTSDGGRDPFSAGTFVDPSGKVTSLTEADFLLEAGDAWTSADGVATYPVSWKIGVPRLGLEVTARALLQDQELRLQPVRYWEGAVAVKGRRGDVAVEGRGYLEMTGYSGSVPGMSGRDASGVVE